MAGTGPRLGHQVPGVGLVVGHAQTGATRWAVAMRVTGDSLCTTWIAEGEGPLDGEPEEACASEWFALVDPHQADPVFVHLTSESGGQDSTYLEGLAGIGLARVDVDYGTGVVSPPLVDLAPISLEGLAFAFSIPGRIDIRRIRGFDGEGREVLSQTL